ncbi:MAG: sugar ABC transporter permease [Caldilineaceae bacterium]
MKSEALTTVAPQRTQPRHRAKLSPMARQEEIAGWLMTLPWIIGSLLWTLGPFGAAAYLSFTDYDILSKSTFIGLENFRTMLTADPLFWTALRVTTVYAFVSVPLQIILGLLLAMLLNAKVRGLAWFRTIYYLPAVLSGVAVSFLWIWIFSADWGILNFLLSLIGIRGPNWLTSETWALPSLILMSLWGVGGGMVIYLAGLQGVPTEFYEAAEVDGAGWWPKFWHITLPMISPVLLFQLIMGIIGALQTFTQGYVMTEGGPNDATLFYLLYLWRNAFQQLQMGYASALAWGIFIYILLLTLLVLRSSSTWVYYTGEIKGR